MEDQNKTADATSGQKDKSDTDASKEVAVGEQGICLPYEPKPFRVEDLMHLSGKAHHFIDEDPTDMFLVRGYKRFAEAAVDLGTRLAYAKAQDERCVIEGCENPAYAPIQVMISNEEGQTGFTLQLEDVRACKPCIKQYCLTIKDGIAY